MIASRLGMLRLAAAVRPVATIQVSARPAMMVSTPSSQSLFNLRGVLRSAFSTEATNETEKKEAATPSTPPAEEFPVPKDLVRFVIGPKGAVLKTLTEKSGATLAFTKKYTEKGEEMAAISGNPEQVAAMKKVLAEEIEVAKTKAANFAAEKAAKGEMRAKGGDSKPSTGERENSGTNSYVEDVIVDTQYVGALIGMKGAVRQEMEAKSGARITYSSREESTGNERTARIRGSPAQVQAAKQLITEKIYAVADEMRSQPQGDRNRRPQRSGYKPSPSDVKQVVEVPTSTVGFLIGAKGKALFYIQDKTSTRLEFAKEDHRNGAREITIFGSEDAVKKACEIIQSRVKECLELRGNDKGQ